MIDLETEDLLSLAEAAATAPGGAVHVSTIHRWRITGLRGVHLETFMRGGLRYTSREALSRFFNAVTAAADAAPIPPLSGSRLAAVEAAERDLAAS